MKILEKAKKVWKAIDGWKTVAGVAIRFVAMGVNAFFPEALTPEQYAFLLFAGDAISGVGGADKVRKWYTGWKQPK